MMFIFGCGYVGLRVADRRVARGQPTAALTRSEDRAATLRERGIRPVVGDVTQPETLSLDLSPGADVLFAVGFDRNAGHSISDVYVDGLRNVLKAMQDCPPRRLIYLSSTGVYGDHQGDWVNEDTPCAPERAGGHACLAAEQALTAHPLFASDEPDAPQSSVLRLAGIYGPGRVPRLRDMESQTPMAAPPNTWLNLIHVDDIVTIVETLLAAPHPPSRLCVNDGHPVRRLDYYSTVAELAGVPAPVWTSDVELAGPQDLDRRRATADKRIGNQRLVDFLQEQNTSLQYPTHRSGLKAILG